ncbi:MAG: type II toxin-antitoxin system RelE/ParE family toxin [Rhodospirillaceae bacterium]|nr:type II toxin-antitoxin system RelE/ParE family toxin [Rhodospirillaceae bacterium]
MRFAHKGLRRFYAHGDAKGLNAAHVARIRRLLSTLQDASSPQDMALPGYRLHRLTGDRHGQWSVRVSGNWRIVFRFVEGVAVDVDLIDYH